MANNILYISDGDHATTPTGYILSLVQGQYGQSIPLEIRDLAGNVVSLTGYSTITGHKRKGGDVTAIVGTFTLSGTPTVAPQITWTVDESDTGDYGNFALFLEITNGTITYTTHPVTLQIVKDPAVNATAAPGLVSVTTAQKALLAALNAALPAANGDVFKYTAGAWETAAESGGGASDVDDLTTTTGQAGQYVRVDSLDADGLEYRDPSQVLSDIGGNIEYIIVVLSDETTALTTGTAKATFVMPYAMTLTSVVATVNTAPTGSAIQVDINEGVSSILSTKLTIDATEKTSATAATPAVISDTALASGAEIILDIDAVGSTIAGAGLKVTLIGTR